MPDNDVSITANYSKINFVGPVNNTTYNYIYANTRGSSFDKVVGP